MVKALIFDGDGVLADTERFAHLPAFNQVFEEFHLTARWFEKDLAFCSRMAKAASTAFSSHYGFSVAK